MKARASGLLVAALVTALAISGCQVDGGGEDAADGTAQGDVEDNEGAAGTGTEAGADDTPMAADDGWVPLHSLDLPAPGTATITVDGETLTTDIECRGPGVLPDGQNNLLLFRTGAQGKVELSDGRQGFFSIARNVAVYDEWIATGGAGSVYDYPGQDYATVDFFIRAEVDGRRGFAHSYWAAPADRDSAGTAMPLVHIQPDGSFTVQHEVRRTGPDILGIHAFAPEGAVTVAGRCDGPWEQQPDQFPTDMTLEFP
jgi:hypothetical protein